MILCFIRKTLGATPAIYSLQSLPRNIAKSIRNSSKVKIQLGTCFLNPFEKRVSKRPRLSALVAEYAVVCSLAAAVETE